MADQEQRAEKTGVGKAAPPESNGSADEYREGEGASGHSDETAPDRPPGKPFYKRPVVMIPLVVGALAAVGGGVGYWLYSRQYETTDDAFIDGHVVQMNPKVSGYVVKLLVTDNQLVHAGDLLLEIDPRDYQAALDQARAAEEAARAKVDQSVAQLSQSEAALRSAQANVTASEATAKNNAENLARLEKLRSSSAVSPQELDAAIAQAKSSAAQVTAAKAQAAEAAAVVTTNRYQLATAKAQADQAVAQTRQAELNLSYTRLTAPITGRVTNRTVELGNYLQPGTALFALVDPNVWVTANYKETQLTHMKVGQPVTVTVDAFPGRKLPAHVDSFQRGTGARFTLLPPENATGNYVKVVQRVPVKLVFDQPPPDDMMLGPGMSVVPSVKVR